MANLCLSNLNKLNDIGVDTPNFNIEKLRADTIENPKWIHIGTGNIFRIFIGSVAQNAIENKKMNTGIIAVETFDKEIVERALRPYDNLTLAVTMKSNGKLEKKVIGSIVESLTLDDYDKLISLFENKNLQIVSFTITEKGYQLKDSEGEFIDFVKRDFESELNNVTHTMSIVTALLYKRFKANQAPLTLLSMDNCSHNGDKIKQAVNDIANKWLELEKVENEFINYINNSVSYPYSMIDKITPRPNDSVRLELENMGIEGMETIKTNRNTYTAPFVNAEEAEYLVIEDNFINGRPDFSSSNVIFTDKDTVNNVETMKVTSCLNPLHTALAVTGSLLCKEYISDCMEDETLVKLVNKIGYDEGLKVVIDPKIINPKDFIDEVINVRFTNPYVKDMPQRIATDTSQKVGIRFGETIKKYGNDASELVGIPLAIAAWLRYLLGIDDNLNPMEISPDPMLEELLKYMNNISIGDKEFNISIILSNQKIFGLNLYDVNLGKKIEKYFMEMISKKGSVRYTLNKYL